MSEKKRERRDAAQRELDRRWAAWANEHRSELRDIGVPECVLASRPSWWSFLETGRAERPSRGAMWWTVECLSSDNLERLHLFLAAIYTKPEDAIHIGLLQWLRHRLGVLDREFEQYAEEWRPLLRELLSWGDAQIEAFIAAQREHFLIDKDSYLSADPSFYVVQYAMRVFGPEADMRKPEQSRPAREIQMLIQELRGKVPPAVIAEQVSQYCADHNIPYG